MLVLTWAYGPLEMDLRSTRVSPCLQAQETRFARKTRVSFCIACNQRHRVLSWYTIRMKMAIAGHSLGYIHSCIVDTGMRHVDSPAIFVQAADRSNISLRAL